MKKQDKSKQRFEYDDREGGHAFKRLRTERQRKANNALDRALKQKNFDPRRSTDVDYDFI